MTSVLLPGYAELIGGTVPTYEELVKDLPSDVVIALAISLNNELSSNRSEEENQKRIFQVVSYRFSPQQISFITACIQRYFIKSEGRFQGHFFGTRYFLEMVLKELNRNAKFPLIDTSPQQEHNFLLAYWVVVDETNGRDNKVLNEVVKLPKDVDSEYRLLWGPVLNQFQFNEETNVPFEIYKLTCFLIYASDRLRPYLKEYINQLGFESIGRLLGSFHQIVMTTTVANEKELLSKLTYIQPKSDVDLRHLDSQAINQLLGQKVTLPDIKKFPLFKKEANRYMVIDNNLYYKKVYRGPLFELRSQTSLKDLKDYNSYSSDIAKDVLEQVVFKSVVSCLPKPQKAILQFDDGSDGDPDGYYRHAGRLLLFEFKGYVFPDSLPGLPEFDEVKKYVDERFIKNSKGSSKGIAQLTNTIEMIAKGSPAFDTEPTGQLINKKLVIYPILCVDDFYFTLPGMNSYLNREFFNLLPQAVKDKMDIRPLTLINLDILFDLCLRERPLEGLVEACDRYHSILQNRRRKYERTGLMNDFLAANASYDEVHKTIFLPPLGPIKSPGPMNCLLAQAGIIQGKLEEIL